jgi:hypothetical protein
MDARTLFLADHARIHAAAVSADDDAAIVALAGFSYEDATLYKLADADLVACLDGGGNSIAWLLWHATRLEDVVVNTLLRGTPEVLDRDGWVAALGIEARDVGTSNSDDEVAGFSERVEATALRAYRAAVGRETRAWVRDLDFATLDTVPDLTERLAAAPPIVGERALWLLRFYSGKSAAFLLTFPITNHGFMHWAEARVTRSHLGHRNP